MIGFPSDEVVQQVQLEGPLNRGEFWQQTGVIERKMLTPNKLNLKKQSVDDLRKLYEERAGTASVLVEAGKWNRK